MGCQKCNRLCSEIKESAKSKSNRIYSFLSTLLKTARGQIDGILNMIEEDRYCIDISHQLMATMAILNKANKEVLSAHLKTCVRNAETAAERDEKIDELIEIMGKVIK